MFQSTPSPRAHCAPAKHITSLTVTEREKPRECVINPGQNEVIVGSQKKWEANRTGSLTLTSTR